MAEPTSTAAGTVAVVGGGLVGILYGIDTNAAIGALCGALVYLSAAREVPALKRIMYFVISLVMGYQFAPELASSQIFGFQPITLTGPAAFVASALVIVTTLAAIRDKRGGGDDR